MSKSTRRDFLAGTVGVGAVAILPGAPIAGLAPIETLASLAAQCKYISAVHMLPGDLHEADWRFSLNGEPLPEGTFCKEVYAPGDESGWAIVFRKPFRNGAVELIRGNWKIWRAESG